MIVIFMYTASISLQTKFINASPQLLAISLFGSTLIVLSSKPDCETRKFPAVPWTMFTENTGPLLVFLVLYLLCVLIILVKVVEGFKGALKKAAWH